MQNGYETALDYLRQVQDIFDEIAEAFEQAEELREQGEAAYNQNDCDTALPYLKQAQQAFGELEDRIEQAVALDQLGDAARIYDEFPVIPDYYQQLEQLHRKLQISYRQVMVLYFLGKIAEIQGYDAQMYDYFEGINQPHNKLGRYRIQEHTLGRVIGIFEILETQDSNNAIHWSYNDVIRLAEMIGDLPTQLNAWRKKARTEHQAGNWDAACEAYQKCLALAAESPVFRDHPGVAEWRREYDELGCSDGEDSETS